MEVLRPGGQLVAVHLKREGTSGNWNSYVVDSRPGLKLPNTSSSTAVRLANFGSTPSPGVSRRIRRTTHGAANAAAH